MMNNSFRLLCSNIPEGKSNIANISNFNGSESGHSTKLTQNSSTQIPSPNIKSSSETVMSLSSPIPSRKRLRSDIIPPTGYSMIPSTWKDRHEKKRNSVTGNPEILTTPVIARSLNTKKPIPPIPRTKTDNSDKESSHKEMMRTLKLLRSGVYQRKVKLNAQKSDFNNSESQDKLNQMLDSTSCFTETRDHGPEPLNSPVSPIIPQGKRIRSDVHLSNGYKMRLAKSKGHQSKKNCPSTGKPVEEKHSQSSGIPVLLRPSLSTNSLNPKNPIPPIQKTENDNVELSTIDEELDHEEMMNSLKLLHSKLSQKRAQLIGRTFNLKSPESELKPKVTFDSSTRTCSPIARTSSRNARHESILPIVSPTHKG